MKHASQMLRWAAAAGLAAHLLAGCAQGTGIEGRWSRSTPPEPGQLANVTYVFLPSGLVTITGRGRQGKPKPSLADVFMPQLAKIDSVDAVGEYTVKDDVLTVVTKQMTLRDKNGKEIETGLKMESKTQISRFKLEGPTLTIDKLDGSKPEVLEKQSAS